VIAATDEYIQGEDLFTQWVADCCDVGEGIAFWAQTGALFQSWKTYAAAANEDAGTQKGFAQKLEAAGFQKGRDRNRGRHWLGLKLNAEPAPEYWQE
jgi:putative DNA primase/helicase